MREGWNERAARHPDQTADGAKKDGNRGMRSSGGYGLPGSSALGELSP